MTKEILPVIFKIVDSRRSGTRRIFIAESAKIARFQRYCHDKIKKSHIALCIFNSYLKPRLDKYFKIFKTHIAQITNY